MLINLENLELNLGGTPILRDVRLPVERNQIYGLIGPNGAGKSSTIFAILGLYATDGGRLELFGRLSTKPSPNTRRRIGVMPEQGGFYGWMNALDYLAWYAGLYGGPRRPIHELLEQVGLSGDDVDRLCSRIGIIDRGRTVLEGPLVERIEPVHWAARDGINAPGAS